MPAFEYSSVSDVGLVRTNNEDAILDNEELGLWLVADGMGGHAAGEVASRIASDTIEQSVKTGHNLSDAIAQAHTAILESAASGDGKYGMGSTVVALYGMGNSYQIAWVGDSRAYCWSKNDSNQFQLRQLTTDHSYVQMLYQSGIISEEELVTHPEKNIITQCLGSNELEQVKVDTIVGQWSSEDWVILCSDGLTDTVSDEAMFEILYRSQTPQDATSALLKEALHNGGKDNISIIIVNPKISIGSRLKEKLRQVAGLNKKSGSQD